MAILVQEIVFTPGNIVSMFASPITCLAAPAAGYVNVILSISHEMTFNSLAYTTATVIQYGTNTPAYPYQFYDEQILSATDDFAAPIDKSDSATVPFTTKRALLATTNLLAATGNSNITAYIVYETKPLVPTP